ncbi:hypothetical protein QBC35DRAFT_253997 [Podospora australis]|uniref:Proteophosphoglycan 5 n=1 Tax=Podospora australis TaxID=1536484 RepID=A0AAN7AGY6_9PEZI|nr:hypothetical protein QBC35DRAFT_253997 [Podospora australis]
MLQHQQLPPKNSPARRRQKRPINSPARKTYASESDMPSEALFPIELSGPLTPQKSASNSPVPSTHPNNSAKPRARNAINGNSNNNRPRLKQQNSQPTSSTSPVPTKQARHTPPQSAPPKPALAAAFAGSTFHASPAPSSLPIPTFLKGLDSPGIKDNGRASQEPSPPATDSEAPTPSHRRLPTDDIQRQESPLDIFFRASRAEKERERRASTANISVPDPAPYSPPVAPQSPLEPRTVPNGFGTVRTRRPMPQRNLSNGIPSHELDGTPGMPIGPAFSMPFNDRIRAARSNEKSASATQQTQQTQQLPQQQQRMPDASERLKAFLAIAPAQSNDQSSQQSATPTRTSCVDYSSPGRAQQYPQPAPLEMRPEHGRPANILGMEDVLRRVLKIDGLNLGPAPPANYHYQSS